MRIFELLNQSPRQELDPNAPPEGEDEQGKLDADQVDNSLQDVGQAVQDRDMQPDLPAGAEQEDPALSNDNVKPLDAALMGQLRTLPYARRYQYDDKSPLNPMSIAALPMEDLSNLRNMVRWKMQQTTMQDQVGVEEDTDMQFYNDLLRFVNTVTKFKKTNTSAQLAATNPSPPYQSTNTQSGGSGQ